MRNRISYVYGKTSKQKSGKRSIGILNVRTRQRIANCWWRRRLSGFLERFSGCAWKAHLVIVHSPSKLVVTRKRNRRVTTKYPRFSNSWVRGSNGRRYSPYDSRILVENRDVHGAFTAQSTSASSYHRFDFLGIRDGFQRDDTQTHNNGRNHSISKKSK